MGNISSMGYGASGDASGAAGDHSASHLVPTDYMQRLPPDELRKYTEGYRRICRVDTNAPQPAPPSARPSKPAPPSSSSRSSSAGALPPVTTAAKRRQVSIGDATTSASAQAALLRGATLPKKVFRDKVLSAYPMIPTSLADRLFDVLDTEHTGELSCGNVLSGIAWLKHGTYTEQVRLLFAIYDLDSAGLVSRDVMDRFMDVVYGRRKARSATTVAFLDRIFESRSSLTLEEFQAVIRERDVDGDALLLRWLSVLADTIGADDDPQILALEQSFNPAVIRQRIADATLFSVSEVTALERQFGRLFIDPTKSNSNATNAKVPRTAFIDKLGGNNSLFPRLLLARVCDKRTTGVLDVVLFDEFCAFVSHFCRGDKSQRVSHLWTLFTDEPGDAGVSHSALDELCALGRACALTESERVRIEQEQRRLEQLQAEHAGRMNKQRFIAWAIDATAIHVLLEQLAFAACILFGVKPEAPPLERRIVEWHWTQATVSFSVGETWNLVGARWWHEWCQHVGMHPLNGTPSGQLPLPVIPEAVRARVGRGIATTAALSSQQGSTDRPGPIANWHLLNRSGSRRLKDQLAFGQDFIMIPSAAYAVLVSWYSGGPDLARAIVECPPGRLEIELFPLVLRVARVDPLNGSVIMSGAEVLLSALSTPTSVLEATCKALLLLKVLPKARLWYFDERASDRKIRLRSDRPQALQEVTQTCVFLLEVQDDDGSWPLSQTSDTISSGASPANASSATSRHRTAGEEEEDEEDETSSDSDDDASDLEDDDDRTATATSGRRQRQRRKRPRDQQRVRLSRTSEICSRGNLESLTTLGGVIKSSKSDATDAAGGTAAASGVASPAAALHSEREQQLAAATTLKKRFSKDAFTGSGLVGLDNLGNTCYMSSALQCLSHTQLLVEYFKNEAYLRDINVRNRDGTNGKLAVAFGELLRVLWTSEKKRFAPTEFKRVVARVNPQFIGSDQHDAQELLACLLSSLSEDLNRITAKPYTQQPDSAGRSDALVATEWWQNHLKRELSVIVALFTGQYKSLLECSVCHYESARFEPFTFLQLSLPESGFRSFVLTLIFNSGRVPMKYSVRVKHTATIAAVQRVVAQFVLELERAERQHATTTLTLQHVEAHLVLARVSAQHTIETLLDGRTPLAQVHEKDQLAVFQLDDLAVQSAATARLQQQQQTVHASEPATPAASSVMNGVHTAAAHASNNANTAHDATATVKPSKNEPVDDVAAADANAPLAKGVAHLEAVDTNALPTKTDELYPVGASVFIRGDRAKDFAPARVLSSSATTNTVDVVLPSGARRYFVSHTKIVARDRDDAFVYFVHRRVERSTSCFTNAHVTRLFGAPLVLRVSLRTTTTYALYLSVWERLRRIFNWQTPPLGADFVASTHDNISAARLRTDVSTLALGDHLALTKFGFCLRTVTSHGAGCSRCEWLDGCLGCLIVPSPLDVIALSAEETVAIDWDIRTLKEAYDPVQASKIDVDDSVQRNRREDNLPLSIERCMDMFTAKERIAEAYCGRCKTHRPATKTMDLWRLPPLLVIQLKRFCFTQVSRRKLHHHVDFPLRGLQLEAFVAKQRAPKRMQESGLQYWQFLGGRLMRDAVAANDDDGDGADDGDSDTVHDELNDERVSSSHARTELVDSDCDTTTSSSASKSPPRSSMSTPVLEAPATAAVRGADGFLYDLYAVVNHVGALGAGHYFAYVLSERDGKWKCFNDHQCKDIDAQEVVSATAYILFYRRRDTHGVPIEALFPPIVTKAKAARSTAAKDGNDDVSEDDENDAADQAQVELLLEQSKLASASGSSCVIS